MVMESKVLISVKELNQILNKVTILDCRYRLTEPDYGFKEFVKSHIPGAFFMDLNSHLASEVKLTGGRHPLPDIDMLKTRLEEIGITNDTSIVCYDDNLSGAGRCWFLLKYMGILNVRVLNGGFDEWNKFGLIVESGTERKVPPGHIDVELNSDLIATHEDILNQSNKHKIIDARETYRYEGRKEPIDKIAGRIPGAINIPYTELMNGTVMKRKDELKKLLNGLQDGDILYCGSGVTSCVNFLAMEYIGIRPKLYVGSYSDWISRDLDVERDQD
jgi:thiosulfate/3-mercaptopyruvate sulfurtransferase